MPRRAIVAMILGLAGAVGPAHGQASVGRSSDAPTAASDLFRTALYQVWEHQKSNKPQAALLNLEFHPAPVLPPMEPPSAPPEAVAAGYTGHRREAAASIAAAAEPATHQPSGQTKPESLVKPALPASAKVPRSPSVESTASPTRAESAVSVKPLPLERIPASQSGRKNLARQLLKEARSHLAAGRVDHAQAIADQLVELAVDYSRFEDCPRDLARDIAKARQNETASSLSR